MTKGYPDYQTWSGRGVLGQNVTSYSFSGSVAGESSGYFDLPAVETGYENIYQCIAISCDDDSAIHNLTLSRVSDSWDFFLVNFINGGIFDFPGQRIGAGQTVRVTITNNSASALTFKGSVFYTLRRI